MERNIGKKLLLTGLLVGGVSGASFAQEVVDQIIVTGVPQGVTKLESTSSVTALTSDEIENRAPRSTAELFRGMPGIHAEASSGDSNTNIKVRGLPISAGGSRYVSFQEDGFPSLLIGDIAFATADSFIRIDKTISSVQSIRGGTSSTLAANAPGGIINLISKTGEEAGGTFTVSTGTDYNSKRTDFEYGAPISDNWAYHVGGFYRSGEGPRDADSSAEQGGQVKATFSGELENATIKVHFKHLDDKTPTYLPIPAKYNGGTSYSPLGIDLESGTMFLDTVDYVNRRDGTEAINGDGFEAEVTSLALVLDYDVSEETKLGFRHRTADIEGNFASPFPAGMTDDANGTYAEIAYFNTKLRDMGNQFTEFSVSHDLGMASVKFGYAMDQQTISTDWNFNQYFRRLDGSLTILDSGTSVNGVSYDGAFGGCCTRAYEFDVEGNSPYVAINGGFDKISWDASFRQNSYDITGSYAEAATSAPQDINGNGIIEANEQAVLSIGAYNSADISVDFDSWSLGANYELDEGLAIFANISDGGSVTSPDRVTGSIGSGATIDEAYYSQVEQYEVGLKYVGDQGSLFITYFNADTTEAAQYEVSSQSVIDNSFEANGFEVEGNYELGNGFAVAGSITFTDAEISASATPANIGNKPRRQADYIFNISPYYETNDWDIGMNIFGSDDVYVQNNNDLKFDSYQLVGLFANYDINDQFQLSLNANNIFDELAFTEGEEGSAVAGDYVRIRPVNGRTTSVSVKYTF
jgi:outer membrane receptor protein involved in Fe transport